MFNFDFVAELEKRNIGYRETGRNVGRNFVGIDCPFCGDTNNHLGLSKSSGYYSCFVCGARGSFEYLIYKLTGEIIKKQKMEFIPEQDPGIDYVDFNYKPLSSTARDYLWSRNYDPDELIDLYKIQDGGLFSRFKYRIMIPYIMNNKIFTYSGRDYSSQQDPKYLHLGTDKSICSCKEIVYGIESCIDTVIVVEGIFDCWRLGKGSVALSGKIPTKKQIDQLKNFKRIFIMFDENSEKESDELAFNLETEFNDVQIINLRVHDPDSLNKDQVIEIKKEIFGKVF